MVELWRERGYAVERVDLGAMLGAGELAASGADRAEESADEAFRHEIRAMLFADAVGITDKQSLMELRDFFAYMNRHFAILVDIIVSNQGFLDKIVGDEANQNNIRTTLENTTVLTAQATETLKSIHKLSGLGQEKVLVLAEQISETLSDTRAFMAKFTEGNGSAARLLNDGQLYENLLESTSELQMALDQLKRLAAEAREKGIKIKL